MTLVGGLMGNSQAVLVGIRGRVLALEPGTGTELWRTRLKGGDFVNIVLTEDRVFAATQGEVFCLDPATGTILWHNPLKGLGTGLTSIAVAGAFSRNAVLMRRRIEEEEAAAAAGAAVL
jgi:outer membrane protein assembly factor BamB